MTSLLFFDGFHFKQRNPNTMACKMLYELTCTPLTGLFSTPFSSHKILMLYLDFWLNCLFLFLFLFPLLIYISFECVFSGIFFFFLYYFLFVSGVKYSDFSLTYNTQCSSQVPSLMLITSLTHSPVTYPPATLFALYS